MKKLMISVSAVTMLFSLAGVAHAVPVIGTSAGAYSSGDNVTPGLDITFDNGEGPVNNVPPATPPLAPFTVGTGPNGSVTFSGSGAIVNNPTPGNAGPGVSAAPFYALAGPGFGPDTTNYLSITAGKQETLSFSTDMRQLGFYWGSIDSGTPTYNQIQFYNVVGNVQTLVYTASGASIPGANPSGDQQNGNTNRYVTFDFGNTDTFNLVVLSADQNSFELDNLSYIAANGGNPSVPEASTWAMMILGFLGVGFISYRRRSQGTALRFV